MKIQYQELKSLTPDELSKETGLKVTAMTLGRIPTGNILIEYDEDGKPVEVPEMVGGIEIDGIVTEIELAKVDAMFLPFGLKRKGGKTLTDEITELKAKVAKLEMKLK